MDTMTTNPARERLLTEEAVKKLQALQEPAGDTEAQHGEADAILCSLLRTLGYHEVVEEWHKVPKWYA